MSAMSLTKAGRYQIVDELGRGAMGVVYRGFDPTIGRTVAVKTVLLDIGDPELIKRFRREAQAAGILSHPNIVTIFDAGEDNGMFYIAMELVEGDTLQQILTRGPLSVAETVSIMEQAGAALDHAHEHEIIHRDIKPANIMLSHGHVKVMDFGVAKIKSVGMTSTGQVLGTPSYMSPELVKGASVDGRSDIFSLGVVLYEMLTGTKPFVGENVTTVIYKIIGEQPEAPATVNPLLNPGLNYVVLKALTKDPAERYQTCEQLVADLKNHAALEEKGKLIARPPSAFAASASAAGKAVSERKTTAAEPAAVSQASGPGMVRGRKTLLAVAAAAILAIGAGIYWQAFRTPAPSGDGPEQIVVPAPAQPAGGSAGPSAPTSAAKSATKHRAQPTASQTGTSQPLGAKAPGKQPISTTSAPAAVGEGRVVVHTTPQGATILVDGQRTAYRSPVNFSLAAGKHRISVEKPGFEKESWEAVVRKDQSTQFRLTLRTTGTKRVGPLFQ